MDIQRRSPRRAGWPARAHALVIRARLPAALIAAATVLPRVLLEIPVTPGRAGITAMIYACAGVFGLLLFHSGRQPLTSLLGSCAALALFVSLIVVIDPVTREVSDRLPQLAISVFLLAASLMLLTRALSPPLSMTLIALVTFLTFMPLWAAPLVEAAGNSAWLTAAVIDPSPLTLFAAALEADYLRTGWFYANSVLGSLRYGYPAWISYCVVLAIVPSASAIAMLLHPTPPSTPFTAPEAHP